MQSATSKATKAPAGTRNYEYQILDSMRTGKLHQDVAAAAQQGFRAVPRSFISYSITNLVLMEKVATSGESFQYQLVQAGNTETLQKEIMQAAEQGFRPVAMNNSNTVLLEKPI